MRTKVIYTTRVVLMHHYANPDLEVIFSAPDKNRIYGREKTLTRSSIRRLMEWTSKHQPDSIDFGMSGLIVRYKVST